MKYGGIVVHKARDEYGIIEVIENRTVRKLHFDTPIEQSCIYRDAPMTLNFEYQQKIVELVNDHYLDCKLPKNYRVLMLGMGGGTIAHHLYHSLPNLQMTIVELRQIVIDAAYQYFHLPNVPEIESVQADAIEYIAQLAKDCLESNDFQFDCILVDIFDSHGIPSELCHADFHINLQPCLKPTGRLIFNLWNRFDENRMLEPTEETAQIRNFWENQKRFAKKQNAYLMRSTSNLILSIDRTHKK